MCLRSGLAVLFPGGLITNLKLLRLSHFAAPLVLLRCDCILPSTSLLSHSSRSLYRVFLILSRMCCVSVSISVLAKLRCWHSRSLLRIENLSTGGIRSLDSPWKVNLRPRKVYKMLTQWTLITFQCSCVVQPCAGMFWLWRKKLIVSKSCLRSVDSPMFLYTIAAIFSMWCYSCLGWRGSHYAGITLALRWIHCLIRGYLLLGGFP